MIDLTSGKVQMSIGVPALLVAAMAVGDFRWIDNAELTIAMSEVTNARREDQLYIVNRELNDLKVKRDARKLKPTELRRLLELEDEAARLRRLLRGT